MPQLQGLPFAGPLGRLCSFSEHRPVWPQPLMPAWESLDTQGALQPRDGPPSALDRSLGRRFVCCIVW